MANNSSDIVYLNAYIPPTGAFYDIASYNVTYDQAILDNPSLYRMAITKFQIPLQELPLLIFPIVPNQGNPNLSPLEIGLVQIAPPFTPFTQPLIWQTQSPDLPVPVQNSQTQIVTPYYYLYNYDQFGTIANTALQAAFVAAGSPGGVAPFFFWSCEEQDWRIGVNYAMIAAGWTVFVNSPLLNLIPGFQYTEYLNPTLRYHIKIINSAGQTAPNPGWSWTDDTAPEPWAWNPALRQPTNTQIICTSFRSLDSFSSLRKLLITTNSLPIQQEYFPVIGSNTISQGNSSTLGIISDFSIDIDNIPGSQRSIAYYDADIYRLISMKSTTPLRKIDFQVYWTDRFNNLYPVYLTDFEGVSVKFAFFKYNVELS